MKLSLAVQLTVLLVTLVVVTSAQDEQKDVEVVRYLDALVKLADTEADQLTEKEKGELDVIRELKNSLQDGGVVKRDVEALQLKTLVRKKRFFFFFIPAIIHAINKARQGE